MTEYQKYAERLAGRSEPPLRAQQVPNMGQGVEAMLRFYEGLARTWTSAVMGFYGAPFFSSGLPFMSNMANPCGYGGVDQSSPPGGDTSLEVETEGARRIRTSLELERGAQDTELHVQQLCSEPPAPPITGVFFAPRHYGRPLVLRIKVPEHQPAGRYHGVVLDKATNRPCGHLSIDLF